MTAHGKLLTLELIAGIFGRVWIIASFAAIVLLVVAIGFDGRWLLFFMAIGTSVIAKRLAKGFHDNKIRVAYEAQLIEQGYSPEEAGRKWLDEHLKQ